jgi:EAL domain-containing protein (putative c-di-GMP-specific phosphodiesterase class I)
MQEALDLRSALEADLSQALERKQLQLFYQPQVNAAARVIGVEVLLRWQHPQRGLLLPHDFIPLAEATGSIQSIGLWVLETACAQLKTWENDAGTRDLILAVNVSARQFRQSDFGAQVRKVLEASCAKPTRLKLELTESLVLEDVQDTIVKMQNIQRLGVSFSMDDFGTGYSSLSSLARLPLDQLKIDGAFVRNLSKKGNDATIARTIITMGREMAMNVIAEGVETVEQRDFLQMHGCHAYQGNLFSPPLPLEEFEEFVKRA